jgi:hypothetical protein
MMPNLEPKSTKTTLKPLPGAEYGVFVETCST